MTARHRKWVGGCLKNREQSSIHSEHIRRARSKINVGRYLGETVSLWEERRVRPSLALYPKLCLSKTQIGEDNTSRRSGLRIALAYVHVTSHA